MKGQSGGEFHRQRTMAGASHVLAQLLLVRREDADAASPARNGHIPLLRTRGGLDGGVGEQNVVHRLALRTVRRDGVAGQELAKARVQYPSVGEFNVAAAAK